MSENETEPAAKTAIRRAAFRLLTTRGISGASFTAIAEESGQGRSLVHYYYPKKDALVLEFLGRLLECIAHAQIPEPAEGGAPAQLVRRGQVYFAFLLRDEGTRRFAREALSNRAITNAIIEQNGAWAFPQIGLPADRGGDAYAAHVISNGGIFELLHEKLVDGSCDLTPAELSSMSLGTFLAICQNRPWKETVEGLSRRALGKEETASLVETVSDELLS